MNDTLPSCLMYSRYLDTACSKFGIDRDTARKKYGLYTEKQWTNLLNTKGE